MSNEANNTLIFGHTWESIQRAQQGRELHRKVDTSKSITCPPTQDDIALFTEHGIAGLEIKKFFGCIERLQNAGYK